MIKFVPMLLTDCTLLILRRIIEGRSIPSKLMKPKDDKYRAVWPTASCAPESANNTIKAKVEPSRRSKEVGGPSGPEPVRYGDWERNGRCIDF